MAQDCVLGTHWRSMSEYGSKGRLMLVKGEINYRSYLDKTDGHKIYVTEIKARSVKLLDPKPAEAVPDEIPDEDTPF